MDFAEAKRIPVGGDAMDFSGGINGGPERATAERVMDSDIPTQSLGRKCRAGDLHVASVGDKEVAKAHAQ